MVKLVDDEIGRRLDDGMRVATPVFGECLFHVNDSTTLAIDAYSLRKHTRALASTHVKRIELVHQVACSSSCPKAILKYHLDRLQSLATLSVLIDTYNHFLGIGRGKQAERRLLRCIGYLVKLEILCLHRCCHHQ